MTERVVADDPVGVGIRLPFEFKNGGLRLTTERLIAIDSGDGINNSGDIGIEVLSPTTEDRIRLIRQALRRILQTRQGDRFMLGAYGSLVDLVPFEVNDIATHNLVLYYATTAIQSQEDRVTLMEASAQASESEPNVIEAFMVYRIDGTEIIDNASVYQRSGDSL